MKHYSPTDYVNWLEEYKVRQKAGLEARKIVASFSKRFFSEHVRIWRRRSSKLLPGSGVCVCLALEALAHPAFFDISLFNALTIPYSLRRLQESLCPFLLSIQQHEAICPGQPYFSQARVRMGVESGREDQPPNVEGIQISVISL